MEKLDDKVVEIAKTLHHHRYLEKKEGVNLIAVGLANVTIKSKDVKLWLINKEYEPVKISFGGFYNDEVIIDRHLTLIKNNGQPIYKNTKYAECIIKNSYGKHIVLTKVGKQEVEIHNTTFYTPQLYTEEATDIKMNINGTKKANTYQSLLELIKHINEYEVQLENLQQQKQQLEAKEQETADVLYQRVGENELETIIDKIDKLETERNTLINQKKNFIRKNLELRYQPILDPWQEEVKRSNLYTKTIAIDGGPGTGKTTSLIQRIKFLVDPVVVNEYLSDLEPSKKRKIIENSSNWVFFSPSELLKQYLKNSMNLEGLTADDSRVHVWSKYKKTVLLRQYNLINTDTQNPFLVLNKYNDNNLLPIEDKNLKKIINDFERFIINDINQRIKKILSIDVTNFVWKIQGESIINYLKKEDSKNYGITELIKLFFNLNDIFLEEVSSIRQSNRNLLNNATAHVVHAFNDNENTKSVVVELIEKWILEKVNIDEDEDSEEENVASKIKSPEENLFDFTRKYIRKKALIQYDKTVRLNTKEKEFEKHLLTIIKIEDINDFDELGQLAFFIKYFDKVIRGVIANLISVIPRLYKNYRKKELEVKNNKWNYDILGYIVEEDAAKNKRIHQDEQAFLINYINGIIKRVYGVSKKKADKLNHPYFTAFKESSRIVIGVDEATDFHLIDLLCIHSLADLDISSVTFSGDLMQRMTNDGIRKWESIGKFINKNDFEIMPLEVSYRQSPTLLEVAETIYETATGKDADYISYADKDNDEPKPLWYVNDDFDQQVDWFSKRIMEIFSAYGRTIPSIALFVSSEAEIGYISSKLADIDALADSGIEVQACYKGNVLGDKAAIRVFSIDYIKGLEFEAVFFHNIENLLKKSSKDMLLKNLYVGLSRATFYLGITSSTIIPELKFIEDKFNMNDGNWSL